MNIKAVLFDLVGTLIYVKDPVGKIYANAASSFGLHVNEKEIERAFQEIFKKKEKPIGSEIEEIKWWQELVYETFKLCNIDIKDKNEKIFEVLFNEFKTKSPWRLYLDVLPVLNEIRKCKISTGIVTNFDSRVLNILNELNLSSYFDCIGYSGKVGYSKPHPKIFQYVLNKLNVVPEEVLYVGDDLELDYYPALNLNIKPILIVRKEKESQIKGITVISRLSQILDYIEI